MVFHFHSKEAIIVNKQPWKIIVKAMIRDNPNHDVRLFFWNTM